MKWSAVGMRICQLFSGSVKFVSFLLLSRFSLPKCLVWCQYNVALTMELDQLKLKAIIKSALDDMLDTKASIVVGQESGTFADFDELHQQRT